MSPAVTAVLWLGCAGPRSSLKGARTRRQDTVISTREWALAGDPSGTDTLAARAWAPNGGEPTWLAVLAHGYGEHLGRYHHIAENLVNAGAVVDGADHRGHGHSSG